MAKHVYMNHLRTFRKKLWLSQRQVAVILGFKSPTVISKLELGKTKPKAEEVFALQVFFRTQSEQLWPGLHHEAKIAVRHNLQDVIEKLRQRHYRSDRKKDRKQITVENLQAISAELSVH